MSSLIPLSPDDAALLDRIKDIASLVDPLQVLLGYNALNLDRIKKQQYFQKISLQNTVTSTTGQFNNFYVQLPQSKIPDWLNSSIVIDFLTYETGTTPFAEAKATRGYPQPVFNFWRSIELRLNSVQVHHIEWPHFAIQMMIMKYFSKQYCDSILSSAGVWQYTNDNFALPDGAAGAWLSNEDPAKLRASQWLSQVSTGGHTMISIPLWLLFPYCLHSPCQSVRTIEIALQNDTLNNWIGSFADSTAASTGATDATVCTFASMHLYLNTYELNSPYAEFMNLNVGKPQRIPYTRYIVEQSTAVADLTVYKSLESPISVMSFFYDNTGAGYRYSFKVPGATIRKRLYIDQIAQDDGTETLTASSNLPTTNYIHAYEQLRQIVAYDTSGMNFGGGSIVDAKSFLQCHFCLAGSLNRKFDQGGNTMFTLQKGSRRIEYEVIVGTVTANWMNTTVWEVEALAETTFETMNVILNGF